LSSFVSVNPEALIANAQDLTGIGSSIRSANSAAAPLTTQVAAAAQDEVSTAIAGMFGSYAEEYQTVVAQAGQFHDQFVQTLNSGAVAYAATETAIASPLQSLPGLAANAAQPAASNFNIGYGNTGNGNVGFFNNGSLNFGIGNISPDLSQTSNPNIFGGFGSFNNGTLNIGAWNTGTLNQGIGNYGTGNSGLNLGFLSLLGGGNTGNYNQGFFNFGTYDLGIGNTGSNLIGIGLTGVNKIGIGPFYISG
jgi:PPE-repeat protein